VGTSPLSRKIAPRRASHTCLTTGTGTATDLDGGPCQARYAPTAAHSVRLRLRLRLRHDLCCDRSRLTVAGSGNTPASSRASTRAALPPCSDCRGTCATWRSGTGAHSRESSKIESVSHATWYPWHGSPVHRLGVPWALSVCSSGGSVPMQRLCHSRCVPTGSFPCCGGPRHFDF
jgi:hypothetical protein